MSLYSFKTTLLSAEKLVGPPESPTRDITAFGVTIVSLSTDDIGVAFNPVPTLTGVLSTINVEGSQISIDGAYSGDEFILLKSDPPSTGTVFTFVSSTDVGLVSATDVTDFADGESLRKYLYGYK